MALTAADDSEANASALSAYRLFISNLTPSRADDPIDQRLSRQNSIDTVLCVTLSLVGPRFSKFELLASYRIAHAGL